MSVVVCEKQENANGAQNRYHADQIIREYLSHQHFDDIDGGCPMIGLPSDITRSDRSIRQAFESALRLMIDIFERVSARVPAHLLMVGDGPELDRAARLARSKGLERSVHFLGEQDRQFAHFQSDAPPCDNCGALTVRCGTCYRCFNCGNSMGCS